jgi:hypothetical protein
MHLQLQHDGWTSRNHLSHKEPLTPLGWTDHCQC